MDEQLYEGGRVKDASALIGWPAMVCVWGKVPLVGSLRSSLRVVLYILSSPSCFISLPPLLSPQSLLLLRLPVCTKSCRHSFAVLDQSIAASERGAKSAIWRLHASLHADSKYVMNSLCLADTSTLTKSMTENPPPPPKKKCSRGRTFREGRKKQEEEDKQ